MEFFECIFGRRSCRRFKQDPIPREHFDKMIDAGRYVPTGFNKQPVRFAIISSPENVAKAFECTGWLTGKPGINEAPVGYIVVLNDTEIAKDAYVASGAATYAVQLAAHSFGYGSCYHGCEGKQQIIDMLDLPENIEPRVLISLGKYGEKAVVHDPSDDWKPRLDDDGALHLGKLGLADVTVAVV